MTDTRAVTYAELVQNTLTLIDSYRDRGFNFGDIANIRDAMSRGEPLTIFDWERWQRIADFAERWSPQRQKSLLSEFRFFYDKYINPNRTQKRELRIVAFDPDNIPVTTDSEVINVATKITNIYPLSIEEIPTDEENLFFRFTYDGRIWVLMNPYLESATTFTPLAFDSAQSFIPNGTRGQITLMGELYTTALLHQILKQYGLYKQGFAEDLTLEKVHFASGPIPDEWPAYLSSPKPLPAFSFSLINRTHWEPLSIMVQDDPNAPYKEPVLNEKLDPQIARIALHNLQVLAGTLRQMGIVMSSWEHVRVNVETGDISLSEEDRPLILNGSRLSSVLSGSRQTSSDGYYFPSLIAFNHMDDNMMLGEQELKYLIDILTLKSLEMTVDQNEFPEGNATFIDVVRHINNRVYPDIETFVQQAMQEFEFFVASKADEELSATVELYKEDIREVVRYYGENLSTIGEGVYVFFGDVLPLILTHYDPSEFVGLSQQYINEASLVERDDRGVAEFWKTVASEIGYLNVNEFLTGSGSGSPSSPAGSSGEGSDPSDDLDGSFMRQAQEVDVTKSVTLSATPLAGAAPRVGANLYFTRSGVRTAWARPGFVAGNPVANGAYKALTISRLAATPKVLR